MPKTPKTMRWLPHAAAFITDPRPFFIYFSHGCSWPICLSLQWCLVMPPTRCDDHRRLVCWILQQLRYHHEMRPHLAGVRSANANRNKARGKVSPWEGKVAPWEGKVAPCEGKVAPCEGGQGSPWNLNGQKGSTSIPAKMSSG